MKIKKKTYRLKFKKITIFQKKKKTYLSFYFIKHMIPHLNKRAYDVGVS